MLEEFRVKELSDTVYCISNFVSEKEEELLLRKIYEAPKIKWTNLLNRRLQNWGGLPKEKVCNLHIYCPQLAHSMYCIKSVYPNTTEFYKYS